MVFLLGCSDAFVAYDVGIPFSYTMQLADNGVHGYLLPSAAIEPTSRDAFEIILAMLDYIWWMAVEGCYARIKYLFT